MSWHWLGPGRGSPVVGRAAGPPWVASWQASRRASPKPVRYGAPGCPRQSAHPLRLAAATMLSNRSRASPVGHRDQNIVLVYHQVAPLPGLGGAAPAAPPRGPAVSPPSWPSASSLARMSPGAGTVPRRRDQVLEDPRRTHHRSRLRIVERHADHLDAEERRVGVLLRRERGTARQLPRKAAPWDEPDT